MPEKRIAAVDGCRGGWVTVQAAIEKAIGDRDSPELGCRKVAEKTLECGFAGSFAEVLSTTEGCDLVLVDMPIGLSEAGPAACESSKPENTWPRQCDLMAKEALGHKRNSLFLAPPRGTLDADNPQEFQRLHRQLTGVGASLPVWGIVPKIIELDGHMNEEVQRRVHEFHPELSWSRLAGRALAKKRSPEGANQRWQILGKWLVADDLESARHWRAAHRPKVAEDDLLDALVGVLTGLTFGQFRFPVESVRDQRGLNMEIYY
ncbi:MAG: DUF429 domain-containing protein [Aureliella sp.]